MRVIAGFAIIYVVWGSSYLAIRFALESIPPFLQVGSRFLAAGALLYAFSRLKGAPAPNWGQWKRSALIGTLMILVTNGSIVAAMQWVDSGLAALLVSSVPLWMVLLNWAGRDGQRPSKGTIVGLAVGFLGVALLAGPTLKSDDYLKEFLAALALVQAAFWWAVGSMLSRRDPHPPSPILATGMQMLFGGLLTLLVAPLAGELRIFEPSAIKLGSVLAWAYLTLFSSALAFSAYIWLLRVSTPARVSTYAFVNPMIAVLLGWFVAGENVTPATLLAMAMIVIAVAMITLQKSPSERL